MTKQKEALFEKAIKDELKKQYIQGLTVGSKSICKVIFDKAIDPKKSPEEKITEIVEFCDKSLGGTNEV